MSRLPARPTLILFLTSSLVVGVSSAANDSGRGLTFDQRVAAQEAIDRLYYSHQIGAAEPFEEAVPRGVLESKVRTYLGQTAVLASRWRTPIDAAALERELARIARDTRFPDRLQEIYEALGNDPFLVQECLARPVLADRLARNFFAFDREIHAASRAEGERLRELLASGRLDALASHPHRHLLEIQQRGVSPGAEAESPEGIRRMDLEPEAYQELRDQAPRSRGEVGPLREDASAFAVTVLLEEGQHRALMAVYSSPKRSWDDWWNEVQRSRDWRSVEATASDAALLPQPGTGRAGGLSTLLAPEGTCLLDDGWLDTTLNDLPEPRAGQSTFWTGSQMLVWGGGRSVGLRTGGSYDPITDAWTSMTLTLAPEGRWGHAAVWTGTEMIVWGGTSDTDDGYPNLQTGGRYNPVADTWTPIAVTGAPSLRTYPVAVWTGTRMLVWGGVGNLLEPVGTGASYDPSSDSWSPITTVGAPSPRTEHSAVWTGDEMVVWGGVSGGTPLDTGGRYDPASDSWTPTPLTNAPQARGGHTATWTGDVMVVWGGSGLDTGGRYAPATDSWSSTSVVDAPPPQDGHTAVWTGSRVIIWGGYDPETFLHVDSGGRYDPGSDTWTPTSTVNAPTPRVLHGAVWTGGLMVVWGGSPTPEDPGGRYDPATDTWTPTSLGSTPKARQYQAGVWTGSRFLIWGGHDFWTPSLNTGGRYDPVTDAWTATSLIGAPTARYLHTAVWSGNRMIVWGGSATPTGMLKSGGRYNPMADTWSATNFPDAPSGRRSHIALWTGTRMLIWGGGSSSGALYNPTNDSWTAISLAGAPAWHSAESAIWTGDSMVVWGGWLTNTGARYTPSTDTWLPTSTAGAPSPRWGHSAVWTGDRMIIWGGANGEDRNDGGTYDPSTDSWGTVSMISAPGARSEHSAVWTGARMVVWGGTETGDGGRYDPLLDTWTPTSFENLPTPRPGHTAVRADDLMMIWGGSLLNSGGIYDPGTAVDFDDDADGYSACGGDCDDGNPTVHPGHAEICDALDNDCDATPDGFVSACGVGGCSSTGFCTAGADSCVPGSPASEVCNGVDDDCDETLAQEEQDGDQDGFIPCLNDCDDADSATHPGAVEVNDGADNQCPGEPGYGVADETSPTSGFTAGNDWYSWDYQANATMYQAVRSLGPTFLSGCVTISTDERYWFDPQVPPVGRVYFYLSRAVAPNLGSWGQSSSGAERSLPCVTAAVEGASGP